MQPLEVTMIMMRAMQEAKKLQQPWLNSNHVLLSVLSHKEYRITQKLEQLGIEYEKIKRQLVQEATLPKRYGKEGCSEIVLTLIENCTSALELIIGMLSIPNCLAYQSMERCFPNVEKIRFPWYNDFGDTDEIQCNSFSGRERKSH